MSLLEKESKQKQEENILMCNFSKDENKISNQLNIAIPRLKSLIKECLQPKPKLTYNDCFWGDRVLFDIEKLKGHIIELRDCRRKNQKAERLQIIKHIEQDLANIKEDHSFFLEYFQPANPGYKYNESYLELRKLYISEINKQINHEFERIYYHFKRTAKSLEDVPMKAILKLMRESFGFENLKNISNNNSPSKYYDGNEMQIK